MVLLCPTLRWALLLVQCDGSCYQRTNYIPSGTSWPISDAGSKKSDISRSQRCAHSPGCRIAALRIHWYEHVLYEYDLFPSTALLAGSPIKSTILDSSIENRGLLLSISVPTHTLHPLPSSHISNQITANHAPSAPTLTTGPGVSPPRAHRHLAITWVCGRFALWDMDRDLELLSTLQ